MTVGLDRAGVHALLWGDRMGNGTVRIVQNDFCEDLLVTKFTLNRVLKRMEEEGRIECLTQGKGATVRTYRIIDPAAWSLREQSGEPLAEPLHPQADGGLGDAHPAADLGHGETVDADHEDGVT